MMKFKSRYAGVFILIIIILGVSFVTGCGSSDDSVITPTSSGSKLLQIEGGLPDELSTAPALGVPEYAVNYNNGKYLVAAVNKDDYNEEIGTVTITGKTFRATLAITAVSKYAVLIIREKTSNKILYQNLLGKTPVLSEMPTGVDSFTLKGVSINSETTARALLAIEKNVVPNLPIVTVSELARGAAKDVTGQKSQFDLAVETAVGGAAVV
ncbi:MAG TPA: hypothetical protein PKK26_19690, partial [Candidatus Wallbacteria bacterium]|nr:hypothetical protein [Candidatus Wallbacteria bacterium]